ncbi:hypothetical protein JCM33374_g2398 [Metschnikowia sp. JCM 33374]|nr:hypothetical protein JCM33374_g2398 [Metschnikowia sp. JCM 33374]
MTRSSRVSKIFKMTIVKKTFGLVPKVSSTGLVVPETTNPTEPSGVNTQSKLYRITRKLSPKETKPSSTEVSSQSPSGFFATETATKTATTTTNGTGSTHHTTSTFTKFSGLFNLDHPAKKTKKVLAKIRAPRWSSQKDGKHSTQTVSTSTVDQYVDTEEVGAINNTSANHGEFASETSLEAEGFQPDFPLATQTQGFKAEVTKASTFPEKGTGQDSSLQLATANGTTMKTPNDRSESKIKQFLRRLTNAAGIQKVCRKSRETSSSEGSLYGNAGTMGHKSREGCWSKRTKESEINMLAPARKCVWESKEASEDGFCRGVFRKLHVDWASRKVGVWSRKVRMDAKSSCSETSSDLGGESTEESESTAELEGAEESDDESYETEDTEDTDDTDDTEDTDSMETFDGVHEHPAVVVSVVEEDLHQTEESRLEVAGDSTQILPKSFPSGVLPISQPSNLSSTREEDTQIANPEIDSTGGISKSTQLSGTSQIYSQGILKQESGSSPCATQELICRVMERVGKTCDDSLTSTETTFLNDRGLLKFLPDTERQEQNTHPVSKSRNRHASQGLVIEGESSSFERPQIHEEETFRTRKFTLAPSHPSQEFMKEIQLVERRSGHVDAERSESVPKTSEGVQAETEKPEESLVPSVESISEVKTPFKRPECGSLTRMSNGLNLDVIERKSETDHATIIDQEVSCLDSMESEKLHVGDYDRLALGLGNFPSKQTDTLWHVLGLTEREDWQRIRDDFVKGQDLHLTCEARKQLSCLTEMRSTTNQNANLGDNNDCEVDFQRPQKASFSPQLDASSTLKAPSKCILKMPTATDTNEFEVLKPIVQPWTVEERQNLAEEMLQRFIDCRATMVKFSGKLGLAQLKDPLDTFTSCFNFMLSKYVRVAKKQFSDYNHYLSEIQNAMTMAVSVLVGAGEQFCNLLEYISTATKSPQSMLEVQEKASVLMSSISTSGLFLQKAQKALAQVTPKDLDYARLMVDLFQKGIHSQTHICYTYRMFRLVFLPDPLEKEEADTATGFGVFDDELYALHEPSSYTGMATFAESLSSAQSSCDVVSKACEELETLIKEIIAGLCKLSSGGSALA